MITEIKDFNIRHLNTFRMNVSCGKFIEYDSPSDIPNILTSLPDGNYFHIGGGSNLLFTGDYPGTILHSRILDMETLSVDSSEVLIRAGAGIEMDSLIDQTCSSGLWGLENLSGIPGEVGAAAVQNVGAYGVEAKDAIDTVECYDNEKRTFVTLKKEDCEYGYRTSLFKQPANIGRFIITHVTFRLTKNPRPVLDYGHVRSHITDINSISPMMIRSIIMDMRAEKLPEISMVGSAGSYFKNPVISRADYDILLEAIETNCGANTTPPHFEMENGVKIPAAWLIEKAGLKGFSLGNAATWHKQPLVIVNKNAKATPEEILALENYIIEEVHSKFGVRLTPEVEHVPN